MITVLVEELQIICVYVFLFSSIVLFILVIAFSAYKQLFWDIYDELINRHTYEIESLGFHLEDIVLLMDLEKKEIEIAR